VAKLLQSNDPREQAWGAWYAGRDVMPQLVPLLERVALQHAGGGFTDSAAATDAAIDSLVQLHAKVPEASMRAIYEHRKAAALILASHNVEAAAPCLLDVATTGETEQWFAAANLLLNVSAKGFATILLRSLSITAQVTISDDGRRGMGSGSAAGIGIGCGAAGPAVGLPPWATYQLTGFASPGAVVLATGPKPMYYVRSVSPAGIGPSAGSSTEGGPSSEARFKYVAAVVGMESADLPVHAVEFHSLPWQGTNQLDAAIERIRSSVVHRHARLIQLLLQRQLLARDDAAALPLPDIEFLIHDARSDASTPLRRYQPASAKASARQAPPPLKLRCGTPNCEP
jgi:hypothetical protein